MFNNTLVVVLEDTNDANGARVGLFPFVVGWTCQSVNHGDQCARSVLASRRRTVVPQAGVSFERIPRGHPELQASVAPLSQHLSTFDFTESSFPFQVCVRLPRVELAFQICWNAGNTLSYFARQIERSQAGSQCPALQTSLQHLS